MNNALQEKLDLEVRVVNIWGGGFSIGMFSIGILFLFLSVSAVIFVLLGTSIDSLYAFIMAFGFAWGITLFVFFFPYQKSRLYISNNELLIPCMIVGIISQKTQKLLFNDIQEIRVEYKLPIINKIIIIGDNFSVDINLFGKDKQKYVDILDFFQDRGIKIISYD